MSKMSENPHTAAVIQDRYGSLVKDYQEDKKAIRMGGCAPESSTQTEKATAEHLYDAASLKAMPDSAKDVSLGCGNPLALASLKAGERVLDLGSGGGLDCLLAAEAVGESGYVIGVDITDEMLSLANKNKAELGLSNVEFRKGRIEALPVDSASIDVILSNCVIDISADKASVFAEAFRVLKPGGRLCISDTVVKGTIAPDVKARIDTFADAVITPLISLESYLAYIEDAGFINLKVDALTSYGLENLSALDEKSRRLLTDGIDWQLEEGAGLFSAIISAYKALGPKPQ